MGPEQMITTAEHFNRAVTLWYELTGLDPNAKRWTVGSLGIQFMTDAMMESMDYDPSFITTYLLLDAYSTSYFKDAKVSVHEFDTDPDKVFDYMDKVREFKKLIRDPAITSVADEFTEQVRKALRSYDVEAARIEEFLADRSKIAYIRRDALKSINRLRADHFLQGDTDPDSVKPVYNREVFGYWNVNSLIEHACSMPSGIALNLIRDPDELHSYFAFSIRNGGNMIMLTDIEEYAHPLGRSMSRRPDKAFDARVERNWFPYGLLSIAYDEKGNPFHEYREAQEQGLIPHQSSHFVLEKLANIGIGEIVWTTLMFDLIMEKYWRNPIPQKALSYTHEMIRLADQNTLLASAAGSNLPVTGYQPLNLPRLTKDDLRLANLDEKALGKSALSGDSAFGINQWMEDRYADLVPDEALNLLGAPTDRLHYLAFDNATEHGPRWHSEKALPVVKEGEVRYIDPMRKTSLGRRVGSFLDTEKNPAYELTQVDGTLFGTREQIDADRKFIGRVNFARSIQREADREFKEKRPEILRWFLDAIEERIDIILGYAHHEKVFHARRNVHRFAREDSENGLEKYRFSWLMPYRVPEEQKYEYPASYDLATMRRFNQGWTRDRGGFHRCYITGAKPTYRLYLLPGSPDDLALLTGTPVEEMPGFLQNWNPGDEPYTGNSILSRIDPMEWRCSNPWNQISFAIEVALSKNGLKKVLKEYEAAPVPDLDHIKTTGLTRQGNRQDQSRIHHTNWDVDKYLNDKEG